MRWYDVECSVMGCGASVGCCILFWDGDLWSRVVSGEELCGGLMWNVMGCVMWCVM